jgi:hypothetical protein
MRRTLMTALLSIVLSVAVLPSSDAQDASPIAGQAGDAALADMGYPELHIKVHDDHFQLQGMAPTGRTLIVYENVGQESRHSLLVRLPDGLDLSDPSMSAESGDAPPPWFFDSTFVGFPGETLPGETSYAVVDLTPGIYILFDDFNASFVVGGPLPVDIPASPNATGTVELFDFNFTFPETMSPGRYVWEVTNTGAQPHELLLVYSPEPVTAEQVLESLDSEDGGIELTPAGGIGWLSPGQTAWTEVDLKSGTYVALCFVFYPATGMPHAMMGMVATFTVDDSGAAPAGATPDTSDSYDY